MTLRTKRRLLRLMGLTAATAAGLVLWGAVRSTPPAAPDAPQARAPSSAHAGAEIAPRLDASRELWTRPLRRPLYDPPPPPPPPVVKQELPPIRSQLLGTIIEPGASKAMVRLPSGKVEFRSKGDALGSDDGDAVILEIGASSIQVARGDEVTELKVTSAY